MKVGREIRASVEVLEAAAAGAEPAIRWVAAAPADPRMAGEPAPAWAGVELEVVALGWVAAKAAATLIAFRMSTRLLMWLSTKGNRPADAV